MISVVVNDDYIKISGHSNPLSENHSLRCEDVTCLCTTLRNYLYYKLDVNYCVLSKGLFYLPLKDIPDDYKNVIEMFMLGIQTLAVNFPDDICVVNSTAHPSVEGINGN